MDETSDILSFDYAMDDELKDEGQEAEIVKSNAKSTKKELSPKKSKSKNNAMGNGNDSKANSKNSSDKKPSVKSTKTTAPVPIKKETAKIKSSTASSTDKVPSVKVEPKEGKYETNIESAVKSTNLLLSNVSKEKAAEYKLYVSGISEETKASDLQDLFTKHAKIIDAKIIRFSKIPNQCFGLVTFENDSQLQKSLQNLNKASLKGCSIMLSQNSPLKTQIKNISVSNAKSNENNKPETVKPIAKTDEVKEKPKAKEDVKASVKEIPKEKDKPKEAAKPVENKSSTKESTKTSKEASSVKKEVKKNPRENIKDKPKANDLKKKSNGKEVQREKEKPSTKERERDSRRPNERSSLRNGRNSSPHRRPVISLSSHSIRQSINQSRMARLQEIRERQELENIKTERMRIQREKERLEYERLKLEQEKLEILRLEREKIAKEREEVARRRQLVEKGRSQKRIAPTATKRSFESRDGGRSPDRFHSSNRRDDSRSFIDSSRFESRDSRPSTSFKRNKFETPIDYETRRHGSNNINDRDERKEFRRESRERRFEEPRRDHRYNEKDTGHTNSGLGLDSARVFNTPAEPRNWVAPPIPAAQWTSSDRWTSNFDASHQAGGGINPSIVASTLNSVPDPLHYSSSYALPMTGLSAPYNMNRRF